MKTFLSSFLFHFLVTFAIGGLAAGLHEERARVLIAYPVNGLAIALAVSCVFRLFVTGGR